MELTARRLTDIYICLMLAAFPLWTGFEGYTGITRAKFLFFAALTGLWLAALRRWLRGAGPEYGAGLVCYLVQSLFGLGLCLVAPIAWVYMGLICSKIEEGETCLEEEGASLRPTS